jgi:hypothetical protein
MRCTPIVTGLVLSSIVFATVSTQAQVSIDVSKITCDQYVHDKIPTPDFVSWPAPGLDDTRLANPTWLSNSIGLRYPIVECLRFGL